MSELNARFKFLLSENEIKKLDTDAAKAGMSRSEYLRSLIRSRPTIPFPKPDLFPFIHEAKEIGLVVNQLTVKAYTQSFVDIEKVSVCMQRLQELLDEFFDLYAEHSAEKKKHPIKNTLIPKGEKRELYFRLTKADKEKLIESADQAKLSTTKYLKHLIEGNRMTEAPPREYWKYANEMRCILVNIYSIYMRAISLSDPAQDVLCEYKQSLEKAISDIVHWF